MKGWKLPPSGELPEGASGVPFQLSRPVFTLRQHEEAKSEDGSRYTLTLSHVPDAGQRYAVALDAHWLSEPAFELDFNEAGLLVKTNSTSSEQFSEVVSSLGSFLVAAINASSGSFLDEAAEIDFANLQDDKEQVDPSRRLQPDQANLGILGAHYFLRVIRDKPQVPQGGGPRPSPMLAAPGVQRRATVQEADELGRLIDALESSDSDARFSLAYPLAPEVALWMETMLHELETLGDTHFSEEEAADPATEQLRAVLPTEEDPNRAPSDKEMLTLPKFDEFASQLQKLVGNGALSLESRREQLSEQESRLLTRFEDTSGALALWFGELDDVLVYEMLERRVRQLALSFTELSPAEWRRRSLEHVELELAHARRRLTSLLVSASDPTAIEEARTEVGRLESIVHTILDVEGLAARRAPLSEFLASVPTTTVATPGGPAQSPEMAQYSLAREELAQLDQEIRAARERVLAAPRSRPVQQPESEPVEAPQSNSSDSSSTERSSSTGSGGTEIVPTVLYAAAGEASATIEQFLSTQAQPPEWVIVLERAPLASGNEGGEQ